MKTLKTGIRGLDSLLGGGIPAGAEVVLYGHPLSGKKPIAMSFLFQGLRDGVPALLVLTDYSYDEWKKMMGWSGFKIEKFEKSGLFRCVDASPEAFSAKELPGFIVRPENPETMDSLSIAISRAAGELAGKGSVRIVFHSVSTLLEKNDAPTVYRFFQFLSGKFRSMNATVVYSLDWGMFEEKDIAMIEHLVDGVIEIGEERLRVRGFLASRTNDWVRFSMKRGNVRVGAGRVRAPAGGKTGVRRAGRKLVKPKARKKGKVLRKTAKRKGRKRGKKKAAWKRRPRGKPEKKRIKRAPGKRRGKAGKTRKQRQARKPRRKKPAAKRKRGALRKKAGMRRKARLKKRRG